MDRNELIEAMRGWDAPLPRVLTVSLESIHSALLNETAVLSQKWLKQDELVILTPSTLITDNKGNLDLTRETIMSEPFALGKVVDFINVNDTVMHRYSEIEVISFYAQDAVESIDDYAVSVLDKSEDKEFNLGGFTASVNRIAGRLGLILNNMLNPST